MTRSPKTSLMFQALGVVMLFIGLVCFVFANPINGWFWDHHFVLAGILFVVSLNAFRFGVRAYNHGRTLQVRTADEILSEGSPYVLYLREFDADAITSKVLNDPNPVVPSVAVSSEEEKLARTLRVIGPGIAVGRPNETYPPRGFSRLYVEDHEWQATVQNLMANARLVVLRVGDTNGLRWEIQTARKLLAPERFVLLVPNDSPLVYKTAAREVTLCPGLTVPRFQRTIVRNTLLSGILYFDFEWRAHYVPLSGWSPTLKRTFDKAFRPVFEHLDVERRTPSE